MTVKAHVFGGTRIPGGRAEVGSISREPDGETMACVCLPCGRTLEIGRAVHGRREGPAVALRIFRGGRSLSPDWGLSSASIASVSLGSAKVIEGAEKTVQSSPCRSRDAAAGVRSSAVVRCLPRGSVRLLLTGEVGQQYLRAASPPLCGRGVVDPQGQTSGQVELGGAAVRAVEPAGLSQTERVPHCGRPKGNIQRAANP